MTRLMDAPEREGLDAVRVRAGEAVRRRARDDLLMVQHEIGTLRRSALTPDDVRTIVEELRRPWWRADVQELLAIVAVRVQGVTSNGSEYRA